MRTYIFIKKIEHSLFGGTSHFINICIFHFIPVFHCIRLYILRMRGIDLHPNLSIFNLHINSPRYIYVYHMHIKCVHNTIKACHLVWSVFWMRCLGVFVFVKMCSYSGFTCTIFPHSSYWISYQLTRLLLQIWP